MVDEPNHDDKTKRADEFLNVRLHGHITVVHETQTSSCEVGSTQPEGQGNQRTSSVTRNRIADFFYLIWRGVSSPVRWVVGKIAEYSDFWVAFATIWIALFTVTLAVTSIKQWHIMQQGLEPEVSVGRPDGTAIEFVGPEDRVTPETVAVYFHNAGHGPALRFWVNLFTAPPSDVPNIIQIDPNDARRMNNGHLQRWRNLTTGEIHEFGGGATLAEGATTYEVLPKQMGLSQDDLEAVKRGTKFFRVEGTVEYCDFFGNYSCETFAAIYQAAPVNQFLVDQATSSCGLLRLPQGSPTQTMTSWGAIITWQPNVIFPPTGTAQGNAAHVLPTKFKLLTPCGEQQEQKNPYRPTVPEK